MNIFASVHSTVTTRLPVLKRWFSLRRILLAAVMLAIVIIGLVIYGASPTNQLAEARSRWAANGYPAYRIVLDYSLPLYACEQDFEVKNEEVTYRNRDSCRMSPVTGNKGGLLELMTVANLFLRIEKSINEPECGPNGCICDGYIGIDVAYDPTLGYPQRLEYRLRPEDRWRSLDFWRSQLSSNAPCPPASYIGQTITITELTPLKPDIGGGLGGQLGLDATPESTAESP